MPISDNFTALQSSFCLLVFLNQTNPSLPMPANPPRGRFLWRIPAVVASGLLFSPYGNRPDQNASVLFCRPVNSHFVILYAFSVHESHTRLFIPVNTVKKDYYQQHASLFYFTVALIRFASFSTSSSSVSYTTMDFCAISKCGLTLFGSSKASFRQQTITCFLLPRAYPAS